MYILGHGEDVGLRCTGTRLNYGRYEFSRSLIDFSGKRKSSLINVRIHVLPEHRFLAENSSLSWFGNSTAIVCDSECPYVTNLNISGFALAVEIRNNGNILLSNMKITNCFYGVLALRNKVNSFMENDQLGRYKGIVRLEKIVVNNTAAGILLADNSSLRIEMEEIAIINCHFAVSILRSLFTRVKLSKLILEYGWNAITLRTTPTRFKQVDLCDDSSSVYNGSFPVKITHYSNYRYNRNPCSMVS